MIRSIKFFNYMVFSIFLMGSCSSKEEVFMKLTQAIPSSGPNTANGLRVKLKGENFQKKARVFFAGKPAGDVIWNSAQELEVTVPANLAAVGFVEVKVVNPVQDDIEGEVVNKNIFSYYAEGQSFRFIPTTIAPITELEFVNKKYTGYSVVSDDFNGDGAPDIAAIGRGAYLQQYQTRLQVRLSRRGDKSEAIYAGIERNVFTNLTTADVNGDGRMDVVGVGHWVFQNSTDYVTTLLSVTKDPLTQKDKVYIVQPLDENTPFPSGIHASSFTLMDINQDGMLDALVSASDKNEWKILPGVPKATQTSFDLSFGAPFWIPFGSLQSTISMIGVIDVQGIPHVVALNRENGLIQLFKRTKDFQFQPVFSPAFTTDSVQNPAPTAMAIADFNGDLLQDIVVANRNPKQQVHSIALFYQTTQGSFEKGPVYSTGESTAPLALAIGDFDKDQRADILVVNQDSNQRIAVKNVSIFLQRGGRFSKPIVVTYEVPKSWDQQDNLVASDIPYPQSVALADFDMDGRLDIAIADPQGWLVVLTNYTTPR